MAEYSEIADCQSSLNYQIANERIANVEFSAQPFLAEAGANRAPHAPIAS